MRPEIKGNSYQRMTGFTLIELMIVVVIIAILAAVAYPSYSEYVVRSNRQAAKNMLYQIADRQEQFFLDNRRYGVSLTELGYGADDIAIDRDAQMTAVGDADQIYTFRIAASTPTTYTIASTPDGTQATRDTRCGSLGITNTGEKIEENDNVDDCW